jgi:ribosomal protein S18 acetylase RimI-like enzyme
LNYRVLPDELAKVAILIFAKAFDNPALLPVLKKLVMRIYPVRTPSDLKRFIRLPYRHYRNDPVWVPPLISEINAQFDPVKNPTLKHCEYELFLLEEDGQVIGRIAAFIDHLALDTWKEPIGLFGYYECIHDISASNMLLEAAAAWLREKGMKYIRGPWSFVSQEWGLVVEGFEPSPVIMGPYNPLYYEALLTGWKLEKVKDLLCYYISAKEGYAIPDRILTLTDDVARRFGISVRHVNMKNYDEEVQSIIDLSNISLADNWGFTSVTEEEARAVAHDLKPIIQPKGVLFAVNEKGESVGFIITIPDVNIILKKIKGKLLPFGWIKLLWELPRLQHFRLFALGVIPEYQGKGIDSLLYRALYESLYTSETWLEINYVLEDNFPMNNAIKKLNAKPLRRYRIYQKII